jgi:hypothetical protein
MRDSSAQVAAASYATSLDSSPMQIGMVGRMHPVIDWVMGGLAREKSRFLLSLGRHPLVLVLSAKIAIFDTVVF